MPRRDDPSDLPPTVTPPELNPLVNPLLAQNMGRWAEVYFTAPPEKREEAVLELLRELGGEASVHQESSAHPATSGEQDSLTPSSDTSVISDSELPLGCGSCGYENRPGQNFCGMCGERLGGASSQSEPAPSQNTQFLPPERASADWPAEEPAVEVSPSSPVREESETVSRDYDLDHMFETAPPSFFHSYRAVIGGALAIAIVLLAYMAWQRGRVGSGLPRVTPQAPPVATEPAAPVQNPIARKPDGGGGTATGATKGEVPSSIASPKPTSGPTASAPGEPNEAPVAPIRAGQHPQAQPGQGNGAEELAIARGYLDGANNQPRDASSAAEWLWKAVAKQNTDATMLLSDLYLRGDGVSKNCDQARVLLDAAARKGRKDAGERLRHMQAFGCE